MDRTDDRKLTQEEEAGLKKVSEESKANHGGRFLTLSKDDATAKYILKQRMKERGENPVPLEHLKHGDPDSIVEINKQETWNKKVDWESFPELEGRKLAKRKQEPGHLWDPLEKFVQLTDSGLGAFREKYPDFLPVWFYAEPSPSCGPEVRKQMRDALAKDVEAGIKTEPQVIEGIGDPPGGHIWRGQGEPQPSLKLGGWRVWQALLRGAWHSGFHPEYVAQLVNIPTAPPSNAIFFEPHPVCDAQRTVLALMIESWRVRFCPRCGAPFIAREEANRYWPKECFTENRKETQRASRRKMRGKARRKQNSK